MRELTGRTALVTGASRGIGRSLAIALADCGADVVVNYTSNDERAREVQQEIEARGVRCHLAKVDLTGSTCAEEMAAIVPEIDILVHNASIQFRRPWQEITLEEYDIQMNCNFRAAFLLIQKYAPRMMEKRWGRIVTIGSVQEQKPHKEMLIYSASKAAQTLMARSLALQLAPYNVTVNSIAPGVMDTDRNSEFLQIESIHRQTCAGIPLGYIGEPGESAGTLKLLCSEEGRYITGQNIFVDGGMGIL